MNFQPPQPPGDDVPPPAPPGDPTPEPRTKRWFGGVPAWARLLVALVALAGQIVYIVLAWSWISHHWNEWHAHESFGAMFTDPRALVSLALFVSELTFGLAFLFGFILAQSQPLQPPTQEETERSYYFVWLGTLIVTIITEILTFAGFAAAGPPGWLIILAILLASILGLYVTAVWLWPGLWVYPGRWWCSVVVPWLVDVLDWIVDTYVDCAEWGWNKYTTCLQWNVEFHQECMQWMSEKTDRCVKWSSSTTKVCDSWFPGPLLGILGDLVCGAWHLVTTAGCILFEAVVIVFCIAWFIVVAIVCLVLVVIWEFICLVFIVVSYLIWAVVAVIVLLVRVFFLC